MGRLFLAAGVPVQGQCRPEGIRTTRRSATPTTSFLNLACNEQAFKSTIVTGNAPVNPIYLCELGVLDVINACLRSRNDD